MNRLAVASVISTMVLLSPVAAATDITGGVSVSLKNSSDDVNFNIASDLSGSMTPNVLSDVRWDNIETWTLQTDGEMSIGDHFVIGLRVAAGAITDGDAIDRDFLGDNRTEEFSRAIATVDGDYALSGHISLGWRLFGEFAAPLFPVGEEGKKIAFASAIEVTPQLGYSYSEKEIAFTDGVQLIPEFGPFDGLNSTYDPTWKGLFVGVETSFRLGGPVHLVMDARYWPALSYLAEADWNLRSDLNHPVSFSHSADGAGYEIEAGLAWQFNEKLTASLTYAEIEFDTDPGTDRVILAQGENLFTRLNRAEWLSRSVRLEFRWRFGG